MEVFADRAPRRDGLDRPRSRGVLAQPGSVLYAVLSVDKNLSTAPVSYEARLIPGDGTTATAVRTWNGLQVNADSDLITLDLPAGSVPPGNYELHVRRTGESVPDVSAVYLLELSAP